MRATVEICNRLRSSKFLYAAMIPHMLLAIGTVSLFNMIYYLRSERSKDLLYGVLYGVKAALRRASELLMQVNARVMGVVLNAFNLRSTGGYYYYYGSKYAGRYYQQSEDEQKLGASAS